MGGLCSHRKKFNHAYLAALSSKGELGKKYSVLRRLGGGRDGTTYLVSLNGDCRTDLPNDSLYVAKECRVVRDGTEEFEKMRELQHPNLTKVLELIHGDSGRLSLHIISEYAAGGDLFQYMQAFHADRGAADDKHLPEEWVAGVFKQAFMGVAYLHDQNTFHNDLKPDNILLMEAYNSKEPFRVPWATITDFGCATGRRTSGIIGDPRYQPPESWVEDLVEPSIGLFPAGAKGDIWSMGVTLFEVLSGGLIAFLYRPCSLEELLQNPKLKEELGGCILHQELHCETHCSGSSEEALTLLKTLCNKDPAHRPPASAILKDQWFGKRLGRSISSDALQKLSFKKSKSTAHAVFMNGLAMKLRREHYKMAWKQFQNTDINRTGTLDREEFERAYIAGLSKLDVSNHDAMQQHKVKAAALFEAGDIDGDGKLDFTEFLALSFDWRTLETTTLKGNLAEFFNQIDTDGDQELDIVELATVFQGLVSEEEVRNIFDQIDFNGDGRISLEELRSWLFDPTEHARSP